MTPDKTSQRFSWPGIVALILVPLLAVTALLALVGRDDKAINAAVVNLDQAVTIDGQYIPMGRQLAAAIIDREGDNVTWTLADAPSAAAGLRTGEYSAVVTIPRGFSAAATSFAANDAGKAEQATISVGVSDNSPVNDSQVAQEVARLAVDTINSTLTGSYLDNIYIGFNTVGEQFTTIVDGAKSLHDGSTQLAEGTLASSQGATQLSDGMALLKENSAALNDGGAQLVSGIGALQSGTGELANGADQLADGVETFATQTPQLVSGVGTLAQGADQLLGGLPAFANGSAAAIQGVTGIREGLDQLIAGLDGAGTGGGAGGDAGGLDQLVAGAQAVQQGATGLATGIGTVSGGLGAYAQGSFDENAKQAIAATSAQFDCPTGTDAATCAALTQVFKAGVSAGFQTGSAVGAAMLTTPGANGQSLQSGASALAEGAGALATGVDTAVEAIAEATGEQLGQLQTALVAIRDGAAQLETQAAPLVTNAPAVADGATQLLAGINQLNQQVGELPAGVNQLSTGARQLADGAAALNSGVGDLATGAQTYVAGVGQYSEGVGSAADGAAELATGLVQLNDGMDSLNEGIGTFASELSKGKDLVPSYSQADREALSKVVANPVDKDSSLIGSGDVALVSLLLSAGLWLGALASFVVRRPIPSDALSSRASSVALWAKTMWLPLAIVAGQGLALGLIGGSVLDLAASKTVALMVLLAVVAASFVLANHALAGWLGNVGRGISVLLLVITVALGLSSAASWLGPAAAVSPLHNGFTLLRTWLAGGSGVVGIATVSVLMFVIAAGLSVMAIARKRKLSAHQFASLF